MSQVSPATASQLRAFCKVHCLQLSKCILQFLWNHDAPSLNPLNAELNPNCHLLALLGAHPILHVSRIRVKHHLEFVEEGGGKSHDARCGEYEGSDRSHCV